MSSRLIIGPFPKFLTKEEKEKFLCYFGALDVNHVIKKNKLYTIARFQNHIDSGYVLKKLHQLELFGKRISAHFYNSRVSLQNRCSSSDDGKKFHNQKEALRKYETQLSAISSNFNILYPLPPKFRYSYPPPTPLVVSNIAHTLVAVPKFYTQVLHLMNKMNLPSPFGPLTEEPSICKEAKLLTKVFDIGNENRNPQITGILSKDDIVPSSEESESEIESDEEIKSMYNKEKNKLKRPLRKKSTKVMKRPKLETLRQTLLIPKDSTAHEAKDDSQILKEVFDVADLKPKRTLNVNVQNAVLDSEAGNKEEEVTEGFGKIYPLAKDDEDGKKKSSHYISSEELMTNRIPSTDWPIVPVFKNYNRGTPSPRLYIKNLAKTVTESDLRYIFGQYVRPESEDALHFNIRVMKEGRMKGQAFVNFASAEIAIKAIDEVNGFILKDKPMVICFGKIKPCEESSTT